MNKAIIAILLVLAVAGGFIGGKMTPSFGATGQDTAGTRGLTTYERGQLIVACYGIQERILPSNQELALKSSSNYSGAVPGSRDKCLEEVRKLQ